MDSPQGLPLPLLGPAGSCLWCHKTKAHCSQRHGCSAAAPRHLAVDRHGASGDVGTCNGWLWIFDQQIRGFHEQNRDIIVKQLGNPDYWNRTIEWDMMFTHQPHDVDLVKIVNLHSIYGHVTMLFLLLIGRWCFQLSTPGWNGLPYF